MNTKEWDAARHRQQDLQRAAERHRTAEEVSDDPPLRRKVGKWMVKTGKRLLEEEIQMGVQVTGTHKHVTG